MADLACRKKDREIRTGELDIKFNRITEFKIANKHVFIDIVLNNDK